MKERQQTHATERDRLRAFVDRWATAGPALEGQRSSELAQLDDETARQMTLDLFQFWQPSELDEMGEGLVAAQEAFGKLARLEAEQHMKE